VPDSARRERLAGAGTPATAGMPAAMIGGPAGHGRGSRAAALGRRRLAREPPGRHQARAGPPECEPHDWAPRRGEQGRFRGQRPGTGRCRGGDQLLSPVAGGVRRLPLRLVVVLAQAGGPAPAAAEPGQRERIEDAPPARSR
jgi:hypothetical protein